MHSFYVDSRTILIWYTDLSTIYERAGRVVVNID